MGIDLKYGVVTTERGTIAKDEPVVVFRAQDRLMIEVMVHYQQLCKKAGSPPQHLSLIGSTIDLVREWQEDHKTQVPKSEQWSPQGD